MSNASTILYMYLQGVKCSGCVQRTPPAICKALYGSGHSSGDCTVNGYESHTHVGGGRRVAGW